VVAVIETDKVNVDIRSTHSGVIKKYFTQEGDTVQVSADFFEIDTDAKEGAAPAKTEAPKKV
jgi:2-oxoglutarate dehydrogenase E2 component (dihydrolipoamide succinyltransferase)